MITESVSLDEVWPDVAVRLRRTLAKGGVPREVAEDVVQEVAVRVLRSAPTFSSADDLWPWALVVARRVVVDLHRANARQELRAEVVAVSHADVEAEVVGRLQAERVLAAFPRLSARNRDAITDSSTATDRSTQVRLAVRRHRARAELAKLVGGLGAAVGGAIAWIRRRAAIVSAGLAVAIVLPALVVWQQRHEADDARPLEPLRRSASRSDAVPENAALHQSDAGQPRRSTSPPARAFRYDATVPVPGHQTPLRTAIRPRQAEDGVVCLHGPPGIGRQCVPRLFASPGPEPP